MYKKNIDSILNEVMASSRSYDGPNFRMLIVQQEVSFNLFRFCTSEIGWNM